MRNCLAILLFLVTLPLSAQSSEVMQVTLVEVPVNVAGSDGQPVRGLTRQNFELYDQGRKQEITHFDVIDFAERAGKRPAMAGAAVASGAARRNFMLLFDLGNSDPASILNARKAASLFVEKLLLPGDRVAVATIAVQNGFQLHTAFTTDQGFILHAIRTLGIPKFFELRDPLKISGADTGAPGSGQTGSRGEIAAEHLRDLAGAWQRGQDEQQRQYVLRQVSEFTNVGRVLDRVAGRKQVILLSEGFDPKMIQGRGGSMNSVEAAEERAAIEHGEVWKVDTDARYGSTEAKTVLQKMVESLRRSDVVLHAIDIKGLRGSIQMGSGQGSETRTNESLFLLTRDTGGQVFRNAVNLEEQFARMLKSQEVAYVLGFVGPARKPGSFHELKVKLVNVPKARVTHRPGYYEVSPVSSSSIDRMLTAGEIIVNSLPVEDVKFAALATALSRGDGLADVPVILEVDGKSLLNKAAGTSVAAEFFIYAFDSDELIRDFAYQRAGFDLNKLGEKIAGKGVKFYQTLNLAPGDYSVRVLVRVDGSRSGFKSVPLHVPAAGEVAATAIFHDAEGWVMVKGSDRYAGRPYPFLVAERSIVPSPGRVITGPGPHDVIMVLQNMTVERVKVGAQIQDAAGGLHDATFSPVSHTPPDSAGGSKLLFSFAPPALPRGAYSLILNIVGSGVEKERRLVLPFRVN